MIPGGKQEEDHPVCVSNPQEGGEEAGFAECRVLECILGQSPCSQETGQ